MVPVDWYLAAGSFRRAPACNPPLEYGGSVRTASIEASGRSRRMARASPRYNMPLSKIVFWSIRGLLCRSSRALSVGTRGPHMIDRPAPGALDGEVQRLPLGQQTTTLAASYLSHVLLIVAPSPATPSLPLVPQGREQLAQAGGPVLLHRASGAAVHAPPAPLMPPWPAASRKSCPAPHPARR